ncbi:MAG TPA: hypothetical protein VNF47_16080 [Streptosporangiaceae bacterium]|nr:hypothetical protein [Streptosporangiaceae bacterium]
MSRSTDSGRGAAVPPVEERVHRLETQLDAITEAVEVLARGLEDGPMAEPASGQVQEAARRTHELLLLAKTASRERP